MVERLKVAIAKARQRRGEAEPAPAPKRDRAPAPQEDNRETDRDRLWMSLPEVMLDSARLAAERVVTYDKTDAAHYAFDTLRTRLLKIAAEQGWRRIGITSPTPSCGKTVVTANLAFSLARQTDIRTVAIDMDLRAPRLTKILAVDEPRAISWFLTGSSSAQKYLQRVGLNLALGLNTERVRDAAELVNSEAARVALAEMIADYRPDLTLYDLPPLLVTDDAMAFVDNLDGVILVAAAGETKPDEIEDCEMMLGEETNLLGVILNKVGEQGEQHHLYGYGYGYGAKHT